MIRRRQRAPLNISPGVRYLERMKRALGAGVLAFLTMAACGGGSDDGGGSSASDCAGVTQVLCQRINECFPYLVKVTWGDVATCAARSKLSCEASLAAPGTSVTEAQIGACASAYEKQACDALLGNSEPAACNVAGSRNDGEPCGFDLQCKSTNCKTAGSECGTCGPRAAAGGSCDVDNDCQTGLLCVNDVCAQPVAAGGACADPDQCQGSLICKGGTCAKGGAAGAACDPQEQDCDFLQGLYCEPQSKVCAQAASAKVGEPCGLVGGKYVGCTQSSCKNGTCAAFAADGAACDETNGPECQEPASCVNGTCKLPASSTCG